MNERGRSPRLKLHQSLLFKNFPKYYFPKYRLEHVLGILIACLLGAFLAHRSLVLGLIACAVAAAVAGFVVGRHYADRPETSSSASNKPSPGGAAAAAQPLPTSTSYLKRQNAASAHSSTEDAAHHSKDHGARKANPSISGSSASASEIAQRFRRYVAEGVPTSLVVLELAPVSERSRSMDTEQLRERAVEAVADAMQTGRDWVCALEGHRMLVLISHAGESAAAQFVERARTALWRRARVASKAGVACVPKDGRALITVLHRARKRAAAARFDVPEGASGPPFPLGQRFSERV